VATNYVARLASENMPALADPLGVLLGPENAPPVITSAAPRITLVPLGGNLTKRVPTTSVPSGYIPLITQPWIWTDIQQWRADIAGVQYVSGVADSDLQQNWDYAAAMLYVLIQSLHELCEISWRPLRYEWIDSKPSSGGPSGGFGRMISFFFEVHVPVLRYNLQAPAAIAGPGLGVTSSASATVGIGYSSGSGGDELTINIP